MQFFLNVRCLQSGSADAKGLGTGASLQRAFPLGSTAGDDDSLIDGARGPPAIVVAAGRGPLLDDDMLSLSLLTARTLSSVLSDGTI